MTINEKDKIEWKIDSTMSSYMFLLHKFGPIFIYGYFVEKIVINDWLNDWSHDE